MSHQLRTADGRTVESAPGRTTRHSFAFGEHYDPDNVSFGPLVCHNDDRLDPGVGYSEHAHSDVEIVTWVLEGALVHTDSLGFSTTLTPGTVQVQSAGSGIVHREMADPTSGPTRFLQTWLRPDAWDLTPGRHLATPELGEDWTEVVGGAGLPLASQGTSLWIARPTSPWRSTLPESGAAHLFVASGQVWVETSSGPVELTDGDALRLVDEPGAAVRTVGAAELLIWTFSEPRQG